MVSLLPVSLSAFPRLDDFISGSAILAASSSVGRKLGSGWPDDWMSIVPGFETSDVSVSLVRFLVSSDVVLLPCSPSLVPPPSFAGVGLGTCSPGKLGWDRGSYAREAGRVYYGATGIYLGFFYAFFHRIVVSDSASRAGV